MMAFPLVDVVALPQGTNPNRQSANPNATAVVDTFQSLLALFAGMGAEQVGEDASTDEPTPGNSDEEAPGTGTSMPEENGEQEEWIPTPRIEQPPPALLVDCRSWLVYELTALAVQQPNTMVPELAQVVESVSNNRSPQEPGDNQTSAEASEHAAEPPVGAVQPLSQPEMKVPALNEAAQLVSWNTASAPGVEPSEPQTDATSYSSPPPANARPVLERISGTDAASTIALGNQSAPRQSTVSTVRQDELRPGSAQPLAFELELTATLRTNSEVPSAKLPVTEVPFKQLVNRPGPEKHPSDVAATEVGRSHASEPPQETKSDAVAAPAAATRSTQDDLPQHRRDTEAIRPSVQDAASGLVKAPEARITTPASANRPVDTDSRNGFSNESKERENKGPQNRKTEPEDGKAVQAAPTRAIGEHVLTTGQGAALGAPVVPAAERGQAVNTPPSPLLSEIAPTDLKPKESVPVETRDFRIPIAPPGVGPVEIRLAQSASGIQVRVHAADGDTRQALQQNLSDLVTNLSQRGLETQNMTIPATKDSSDPVRGQAGDVIQQERLGSIQPHDIVSSSRDQASYDAHPDRQHQPSRDSNKKKKAQQKSSSEGAKEVSWLMSRV